MKPGTVAVLLLFSVAIVVGIWIAGGIRVHDKNSATTPEGKQAIITEITIGVPTSQKPNPSLEQKNTYTAGEAIAMRVTAGPEVKDPFEISVRLLTENGAVVALSPPTAKFSPGSSTFCCWHVAEAGQYTLQIFRPEGIVSTIPLTIQPAPAQAQPIPNTKVL